MGQEKTTLGSIHISTNAIATITYHATLQSYGVVGLAPKNLAEGIAATIIREPTRGVNVHFAHDNLAIDLCIFVVFGTRIASVSLSVANAVRYSVEKNVGLKVHAVNVHIQGLRVSNAD